MEKKAAAPAATEKVVAKAGDTSLVLKSADTTTGTVHKAGERGPKSSLETGTADAKPAAKGMEYAVQLHTAADGLQVKYVRAESGDEAASKVLVAAGVKDASIRGVTPASDPDANSLGGERDAAQMLSNASNDGHIVNTLGTEANAEITEKLGKSDIETLRD